VPGGEKYQLRGLPIRRHFRSPSSLVQTQSRRLLSMTTAMVGARMAARWRDVSTDRRDGDAAGRGSGGGWTCAPRNPNSLAEPGIAATSR